MYVEINPKTPTRKEGKVAELNDGIEVWWDKTVEVDRAVEVNQPNIVLLDQKNQPALLIEVSCPADTNMVKKTVEKIS
eukprot:14939048-Ditylum_brightwellii.AAC.1